MMAERAGQKNPVAILPAIKGIMQEVVPYYPDI
jgi:hypothetical protein